ncbi:MAG: carbohydrate kinase [Pirellulaceae bacterium]|jgi:fructokinase|nr:carbohydrate kinase [Pirellulaceae bacterium]
MTPRRPFVIGIGELLWDLLPAGKQLGGAPANFSYHAHQLGADVSLVSAVGDDPLGHELRQRLASWGVNGEHVQTVPAPTGTVSVKLDTARHPTFTIHERVAWDRLELTPAAQQLVSRADAVCFGTLAQRSEPSRATIRALVKRAPSRALKVLDVNLRQQFYSRNCLDASLRLANVLKLNDDELPTVAEMLEISGAPREQIQQIADHYLVPTIILTRGDQGSLIYRDGQWLDHPGVAADVADTVGAGDAFAAAATLGLWAGWSLAEISEQANAVAAYVATQSGATPPLPDPLREKFLAAFAG